MDPEIVLPLLIVPMLFIGLPWLIFHYVTKWKVNSSLTGEDEKMLDELYDLARRLDDRMNTIERIMKADNPGWNPVGYDAPPTPRLEKADPADFEPIREVSRSRARTKQERI